MITILLYTIYCGGVIAMVLIAQHALNNSKASTAGQLFGTVVAALLWPLFWILVFGQVIWEKKNGRS
tara:strand:+ start:80 stop:280 length:201 start_codon:yes stop_codon:yes gene_type:complete